MKTDVVVSAWNRSTEWTTKFDNERFNVIVYTKNETQPESDTNMCKNVGAEASTYLKHIVQNYDTLTEKTVFLHDEEFSWHHDGSIVDVVSNSMSYYFFNLNHYKMNTILNNPVLPLIIDCFYKPFLRPYIGEFTKYGDWHIDRKGCAQFVIHRDIIRSKPKKMYQDLYHWIRTSTLSRDVRYNKLEAYIMEWTWDLIFLAPICDPSDNEKLEIPKELPNKQKLEIPTKQTNKLLQRLQNAIQGFQVDMATQDEHGWMDDNICKVFEKLDKKTDLFMIELGSWKGKSSVAFGKHLKKTNGQILCIDTWLGAPEFWTWGIDDPTRGKSLLTKHGYPSVYYTFLNNVFIHKLDNTIIPFPISGDQAACVLRYYKIAADAVYVDASHEEHEVYKDLNYYWGLVKPGGIIFGDDYCRGWQGVVNAVTRFSSEHKLKVEIHGVVWFIKKC